MQYNKLLLFLLVIFFFGSCHSPAESPFPAITFKKKTALPHGRASAVAFVIDGKGYVALGRSEFRSGSLNDCWQYDPALDNWTEKAAFPGLARVKAMAAVVNGKAYVGLGFNISLGVYNDSACLKDFRMYDPITDLWTKKADFPGNFTDACASFVYNNSIYVTSGFNGANFNNELWRFNPDQGETGSWVKLNNFPGPPRAGGIACANNEHCYFGTGYRTINENDWWEYFPANDSWTKRKAMPDNGRENAVSLNINNRIFVATGRHFGGNLTGGHVKPNVLEYNPEHNEWYERGNIPGGERENAVSFTINGKGFIGFGENDTEVLNDLWSFEP